MRFVIHTLIHVRTMTRHLCLYRRLKCPASLSAARSQTSVTSLISLSTTSSSARRVGERSGNPRLCRQKPPNSGKTIPEACPSDQEAWPAAGRRFAMLGKYRSQLVAICVYPVFTRLFANDQQETTKKPTRHRLENTIRSSEHRPRLALRARTTATTRTTTRRPPRNLQETQRNHQQTTRTAFWQRGILLQRHDSSLPETVRP